MHTYNHNETAAIIIALEKIKGKIQIYQSNFDGFRFRSRGVVHCRIILHERERNRDVFLDVNKEKNVEKVEELLLSSRSVPKKKKKKLFDFIIFSLQKIYIYNIFIHTIKALRNRDIQWSSYIKYARGFAIQIAPPSLLCMTNNAFKALLSTYLPFFVYTYTNSNVSFAFIHSFSNFMHHFVFIYEFILHL